MSEACSPEMGTGVHADLSLKMWEGRRCERVHYSITPARLSMLPIERERDAFLKFHCSCFYISSFLEQKCFISTIVDITLFLSPFIQLMKIT